jgi:hypothetical protein
MIGKKYFLNAIAGAFSEIPTPGQHQHTFEEVTGRLLHIKFKETKAGEVIRLYVVDDLNLYIISMFVKSRPANVFFLVAQNLDLHSEIKFKMKREVDAKDGKPKDFLSIHQHGNSIRWYYDESNKHELPQGIEERRALLKGIVENITVPALSKIVNPFPSHPIYKPLGSGNGLQGGYFKDDNIRVRKNFHATPAEKESFQFNRNRHFPE